MPSSNNLVTLALRQAGEHSIYNGPPGPSRQASVLPQTVRGYNSVQTNWDKHRLVREAVTIEAGTVVLGEDKSLQKTVIYTFGQASVYCMNCQSISFQ